MNTLRIKDLIDFRRRSPERKRKFVQDINIEKIKADKDGGGDYWVSCLSALSNAYEANDISYVPDKISQLEEMIEETPFEVTKKRFRQNIQILRKYEDYSFNNLIPKTQLKFLRKEKNKSVLKVKDLDIQAKPNHVFTFKKGESQHIGGIWFIAQKNGLEDFELGMFTDILYRYLKKHYSEEYNIDPKYCIAVDVVKQEEVNYSQLEKSEVSLVLISTLNEIKKLM